MTASAQIVGTVRGVPNSAPISSPDSGASHKSNFRSVLEQYHASRENTSETDDAKYATQQKQKDSDPATLVVPQPVTPAVEGARRILPFTASITLRQSTPASPDDTAVQDSTAAADPNAAPSGIGNSLTTSERGIAYQRRSSNQRSAEAVVVNGASQESQKVSDPTQAVTVPIPVTNTAEAQPPIQLPLGSNSPRPDANATRSGSATPQESSLAPGTDPRASTLPAVEHAEDTTAASNSGALAFAARLTPNAEVQPSAPEPTGPADPPSRSQTPLQPANLITAKQIATGSDLPADAHSGEGESQGEKEKASERFAKSDTILPQIHTAVADQPAIAANNHASTSPMPSSAHLEQVLDPPAVAPKTNNDITVRIPDATEQGTAVRFVERAGEIHVSVRTGDVEMAQSLRGGLNDLVNHLEDGGIRTEVWQPGHGSNAAFSQNDSHHPFADPDGSNGRQYPSGSNSEQESQQQNKPRWVEELEGSIGNPNSKETTKLLWQA